MYHGTFLQTTEGVTTREGVHMIDTLDCPENVGKFFFLTIPETNQIASEFVTDPREFAYVRPYSLYSLDELPEGFNKMIARHTYTEEGGFDEFFDLEVWKYNCELSIRELKMEALLGADWVDINAVRQFEEAVRAYDGTGERPVLSAS